MGCSTLFSRGLIDVLRQGHWFEDPSNSSIACRQTGPMAIDTIESDEGGQEIFSQPQNLAFKIRRAWTLDVEVGPEGAGPGPPGSMLEGAPTYGTTDTPNWSDRRWGQQVPDCYGARIALGGGGLPGWRAAGCPPVRHAPFNSSAAC
jgi:CreA protein